jgi:hypothetical protein
MPSTAKPGTPDWYLETLNRRLDDRYAALQKRHDYYAGRHPLLFATDEFLEIFQDMLRPLAVNFVSLVVDATLERLQLAGFRVGGEQTADELANRIWASGMASTSTVAHRLSLAMGESAISVWSGGRDGLPNIAVEDPRQVVVDFDGSQPTNRRAALKRWNDGAKAYATLYLPDAIYKYEQALGASNIEAAKLGPTIITKATGAWTRRSVAGESWPLANPLGVVPIVPIVNRPDIFGTGISEMDTVLPLQDAVNKLACDMLVASEFAAFRQRWMTPVDPVTGQQVMDFRSSVDRILAVSDPTARMGEFGSTDLSNYVTGIEAFVQQMASISHTPPHYLLGRSGVIPSGDAVASAESGLVSKVRAHQVEKDPAWCEVIRLGFLVMGERERAERQIAGIWTDPERRSRSELMDSLSKEKALGIPDEFLWSRAGYDPTEIAQIKAIRSQQQRELANAWNPRSDNFDPEVLARMTESFGQLYRSGVDPLAALQAVGLPRLAHTGDAPVTTREAETPPPEPTALPTAV